MYLFLPLLVLKLVPWSENLAKRHCEESVNVVEEKAKEYLQKDFKREKVSITLKLKDNLEGRFTVKRKDDHEITYKMDDEVEDKLIQGLNRK